MTTGSIQDRRRFAQEQLVAMTSQPSAEHPDALRAIVASVLSFTPVSDSLIAVANPLLPSSVTVIGNLTNEFGPDYLAVHSDLSTLQNATRRLDYVTLAQVQAANDVVQRHAAEERYPLLVFTLPDNSGVQFITGNPAPGNRYRLRDVVRVPPTGTAPTALCWTAWTEWATRSPEAASLSGPSATASTSSPSPTSSSGTTKRPMTQRWLVQ